MNAVSLSDLFYKISGVKLDSPASRADRQILVPGRFSSITNPSLAEYRVRQFLRREEMTRVDMQFDQRIPTFARFQDRPAACDDYQEDVWRRLLAARTADGWGNRSVKSRVREIRQSIRLDHSLFGIRASLFCDMLHTSAGLSSAEATPDDVREKARNVTLAFLAQRDYLTASICLLQEAMLANTHALISPNNSHLDSAIAAIKAAEDMLIGRSREYDRSLINLVLLQAAANGIDIAVNARSEKFAREQVNLLERSWEEGDGNSNLKDWLMLARLRSRSDYYLVIGEYDRCGEDLAHACILYDQMGQNLPFLAFLLRIFDWATRVRPKGLLQEALAVYATRWMRNPRLSHLAHVRRLMGRSNLKLGLTTPAPGKTEFGARVAILSKDERLLRL